MIVDQQLDAVVRAGLFRDRQHALNEAMHTLFAVRPQLRTEAAVELFRSEKISLLRAAEMAGLDFESFRLLLRDRGIAWEIAPKRAAILTEVYVSSLGSSESDRSRHEYHLDIRSRRCDSSAEAAARGKATSHHAGNLQ